MFDNITETFPVEALLKCFDKIGEDESVNIY